MQRCYLDHNATTPLAPAVLEEMVRALRDYPGNPSSTHDEGVEARERLDDARARVARCLGIEPEEVTFTGGGTEANNLVILGVCLAARTRPAHIVTTAIEHASVLETCRAMERHGLAEVSYIRPTSDGLVTVHDIELAMRPDTALVSVMAANNETGARMPIDQLAELTRKIGAAFHTDAVQLAGKYELCPRAWGVDFMTLSAHKFNGPKGTGILYRRAGVHWEAPLNGGEQEHGVRPGTENFAGILGAALALELAVRSRADDRCKQLRDRLWQGLSQKLDNLTLNTPLERSVDNTLNVSFEGVKADSLLLALNLAGISASTGSACHARERKPSHVLTAMGRPESVARSAIRFSLGQTTTEADIERTIESTCKAVARLRQFS